MAARKQRVMLAAHRPAHIVKAALQPMFAGLIGDLANRPKGTIVDAVPSLGLSLAVMHWANGAPGQEAGLSTYVRTAVSPALHTGQWGRVEDGERFRTVFANLVAHSEGETYPAIRRGTEVDWTSLYRSIRDEQLSACTDVLLGWDPHRRAGSTLQVLRQALASELAITIITPDGSSTGRLTPAAAREYAAGLTPPVDPWRSADMSGYAGILDLAVETPASA